MGGGRENGKPTCRRFPARVPCVRVRMDEPTDTLERESYSHRLTHPDAGSGSRANDRGEFMLHRDGA